MKNKLKEVILAKCELINSTRKKREKKWKPTDELRTLAKKLKVSYYTAYHWYINEKQPDKNKNWIKLPELYGMTLDDFYYNDEGGQ